MTARQEWRTWANLVTAVRAVAGLALFAVAAVRRDPILNYVGLGVYWVLDVLDGYLARRLDQETRFGAQLDILCDRLLVSCFYLNYLYLDDRPGTVVPIALFLIQFMVIDHYLSNQFLRWPILSPNYFWQADRAIWRLNWSLLGKATNTGLVTLLLVLVPSPWPATVACVALIGLKLYSCVKLLKLPAPEQAWVLTAERRSPP
jgi:CDP-diacylglycerol--glycerol-3-phosphate 3-phosphatidyltransferase